MFESLSAYGRGLEQYDFYILYKIGAINFMTRPSFLLPQKNRGLKFIELPRDIDTC